MEELLIKSYRFLKRYVLEIIICLCIIFCTWTIYKYYDQFGEGGVSNNTNDWGVFGDYIGGIIGSIFTLISAVLIYFTFKEQRNNSNHEKFENKFYELLKLHKENMSEIRLEDESGRKVFVLLIREYREILKIVRSEARINNVTIDNLKIIELAYMVLFYGTGPNSTRVLKRSMPDYSDDFMERLADILHKKKKKVKKLRKLAFVPFEGHQHRLGHYFRHLYQIITYVHSNNKLSSDEKKGYVKTVRAQLSNHEQALLFFNSMSKLGKPWLKEGLITEYSLVKNLPKDFIDEMSEIDIKSVYPNIVFEYEEGYPVV
ncbi:putative phage abortive infection protein [Algoriphagus ratkowskyi]|uniref:Putative phage abortive infection protein n=1 Tax=Algoriphagus ratkowskyi TaxID=57028 RepID=A0A2W7RSU4_9BACT|nr:putative phage abortive infection protein [Algoriphagus ratkowskyi]PZX57599.1 putative phage abortive infection protein [Algoriphagus ratkowskyi]TXD78874.1 hypothetical protein ESW18_04975 [Algoriphagus ratkowskyi]